MFLGRHSLHHHLIITVPHNLILAELHLVEAFDMQAEAIFTDNIADDLAGRVTRRGEASSRVLLNPVSCDLSVTVKQDYAVLVKLDLVVFDSQPTFTLDDEDAFSALGIRYLIPLNDGTARVDTSQSHIRLDALLDFVRVNFRTRAFSDKDSLSVIARDQVGIFEFIDSQIWFAFFTDADFFDSWSGRRWLDRQRDIS